MSKSDGSVMNSKNVAKWAIGVGSIIALILGILLIVEKERLILWIFGISSAVLITFGAFYGFNKKMLAWRIIAYIFGLTLLVFIILNRLDIGYYIFGSIMIILSCMLLVLSIKSLMKKTADKFKKFIAVSSLIAGLVGIALGILFILIGSGTTGSSDALFITLGVLLIVEAVLLSLRIFEKKN